MADENLPGRQMSLIPYASESREIVLRRGNAVVLYDPRSHQLSVRDGSDRPLEMADCPFCHRPLHDEDLTDDDVGHGRPYSSDGPFVDPDYFTILAVSQHPSPAGSGRSTPTHVLPPALPSIRSREASASVEPPAGAEFVASEPSPSSRRGISSSAFSPGYFKRFFKEERELGRGGNGVVLLVEHLLDGVSLGHFACKRIPVGDSHIWLEKILVEVKLLQRMPHKNIVRCHFTWLEDFQPSQFGPSIPCLWILQDFCNGGDLHNYVLGPREVLTTAQQMKERMRRRSRGEPTPPKDLRAGMSKLSLEEIFSFFRDITSGLHHLHSNGYIHRDLKPSNCLLQRDGAKIRVMISDFGEVQEEGSVRGSTGATGTISYCAPEVLRRGPDGAFGNFTTKSDVFSLGMIVHFMCFGRLPYVNADGVDEENEDLELLRAEIATWPGFDEETRNRTDLPEKLYRFLRRLLSVDPTLRPSTDEILSSIIIGGSGVSPSGDHADAFLTDHFPPLNPANPSSSTSSPSPSAPTASGPRRRKPSALIPRSGLPSPALRRHSSTELVRSRSPTKRETPTRASGPVSPAPTTTTERPTSSASSGRRTHLSSPHLSPRLLLPPPPPRRPATPFQRLMAFTRRPEAGRALRVVVCLAKVLSVTAPCAPYSVVPAVWYPLLLVAVLELSVLRFGPGRAAVAWGVHFLVVLIALRRGRMCEVAARPGELHGGGEWYGGG